MSATTSPVRHTPGILPLAVALLLLSFLISLMLRPDPPTVAAWDEALRLAFIPNEGQTDRDVRYQAHGLGGTLFFTEEGVMLSLPTAEEARYAVRLHFEGASPDTTLTAETPLGGRVSYLLGSDADAWRSGLPTYGALRYEALYPGIDLHYDGVDGRLKGTYLVAPGGDPALVRWRYEGATSVAVEAASGDLLVALPGGAGTIREEAPVAWQQIDGAQVGVAVRYDVAPDGRIGFALPDGYDPTIALTLDPTIEYASRIGGTVGDSAFAIAVDATGAVYLAGETDSPNYPGTPGVVQTHSGGATDAVVTKLSPDGATILYSTYLGGTSDDVARDIAVDATGQAHVVGYTHSTNFPTTAGAFQTARSGYADAFVVKLNPTGTNFGYATYLGGTNYEGGNPTISLGAASIALDPQGRAYVTGKTWSVTTFPTQNPIQAQSAGGDDAFVTVLEPDGASLYFSTYFGAPLEEGGQGIAVDSAGMIYITGDTSSSYGFPLVNPLQGTYGGPYRDVFIAKIDPVTPEVVYSTYLGGEFVDTPEDIVVDDQGRATVAGRTASDDFPTLFSVQPYGGDYDIFLSRLSANGASLEFSTYIGGSARDEAEALAIDPQGYFYIAGSTMSDDFPVDEPVQATRGGQSDGVALRLFPNGTVDYATYLGGASTDYGLGIAADADQSAYVTGMTRSADFPPGAPPPGNTWDDVFVVKLEGEPGTPPTPSASATATSGPSPTATPDPGLCAGGTPSDVIYFNDFEADDGGWVESGFGDWEWGEVVVPGADENCDSSPLPEPPGAYSGTNAWATNLDGCYANSGVASTLSQTFDFGDVEGPITLSWYQWYSIFGTFDYGTVVVNGDAIYEITTSVPTDDWEDAMLDLSAYAGNASVTIEFELFATTVVNRYGWYIDDVQLTGCTAGTGPTPTATNTSTTPTATPEVTPTATPGPAMMLEPPSMSVMQEPGQSTEHPTMLYNMQSAPMTWTVTEAAGSCSLPGAIPWLSVSPTMGTTPASSQSMLLVTIDTMGMAMGTYNALLCVTDDANHEMAMPISLTVIEVSKQLFLPCVNR